jgi:hypothetical protein
VEVVCHFLSDDGVAGGRATWNFHAVRHLSSSIALSSLMRSHIYAKRRNALPVLSSDYQSPLAID